MKDETLIITLVQNLLYPSILGAMFYNFLPVLFDINLILDNKLLFFSTLLLFCHFFIDYVFTLKFPSYGVLVGILDTIALILVYRTEYLLNPISTQEFSSSPAFMLFLVNVLFLFWDLYYKEWKLMRLNLFGVVAFFICTYIYTNIIFFILIQIVMISALSVSFVKKLQEVE